MAQSLARVERLEQVRSFIELRQRASIGELADQFQVSPVTVRRVVKELAGRGDIRAIRGGAVAARRAPRELPVRQRAAEQSELKALIGQAATALVGDGETVFLGSGTTVHEVAKNLTGRSGLTVLTNSLLVIDTLIDSPDVSVVALGGELRRSELSLIGHIAEHVLHDLRATTVIMGIHAIHPELGLTNDYLPETMTDRAILGLGARVVVVADHTKCGRVSAAFVAPVTAIDSLVTDAGAPEAFVAALRDQGVTVLTV
jgi:DeoR/GlpR family transcriptional regulator of sugar metabolism